MTISYLDMQAGDMLTALGDDAMKWAEAFVQRFPGLPVEDVYGWFASAIENSWDLRNSEITHSDTALADHVSQLLRNRDLWREIAETPASEAAPSS
jgi:hypothetical protein